MKVKIINFLSKVATACKSAFLFDHKNFNFFWSRKKFFFLDFFGKLNTKLCFHLPSDFLYTNSRKNSGGIDDFSVN